MNQPLVYIIILNWNGLQWLKQCLPSVLQTDYPNFKILLVDNGSTDGSVKWIKENYPNIELIENKKNYGFAEGNNIGIRYALKQGAKYIALLNPDTKVALDWLSRLIEVANQDKKMGILSPMQYDYQGKNIDKNFFKVLNKIEGFNKDFKQGQLKKIYYSPFVIGAAMLLSCELCKKVGLFDPLYFTYWEEDDLCKRALHKQFKIAVVTASKIFHWHTLIHPEAVSKKSRYLYLRNQFIYSLKSPNHSFLYNLKKYISKDGAIKVVNNYGSLKNFKYLLKILGIQIWILVHLPLIALRHYQENKRACYL